MLDSHDLLNSVKKAAVEAVDASKPTTAVFGKVISVSPLKINVEQKMTLTAAQLVLTGNIDNIKTSIVGDEVVLLRMQGGQKYIVLDRVVKA